jgi:purine-nucleoside phosphorylase
MVLMFCGRLHYYEGYPMWRVAYPMRILQALEVKSALLTAAAGGLREDLKVGDLVLIRDHISLMPDNPLRGIIDPKLGDRFPDLTVAYNHAFASELKSAANREQIDLKEGVYAGLQGPSLETQAECNFLRFAGGDIVGMSIIPEVIIGVQAGIRMAALCVVSNLAWHPESLAPSKVP